MIKDIGRWSEQMQSCTGTGLFALDFIRIAVNFAPFYIRLREPNISNTMYYQIVQIQFLPKLFLARAANYITVHLAV